MIIKEFIFRKKHECKNTRHFDFDRFDPPIGGERSQNLFSGNTDQA
jgi:hypothetical protein